MLSANKRVGLFSSWGAAAVALALLAMVAYVGLVAIYAIGELIGQAVTWTAVASSLGGAAFGIWIGRES